MTPAAGVLLSAGPGADLGAAPGPPRRSRTPVAGFLSGLLMQQVATNALRLVQPLLIARLSGSLGHAAFFAAFETSVHMTGTLVGGWPVDRLGPRLVLTLGAFLRAATLTAIPILIALGQVSLWWAIPLYALDSFLDGLLDTAEHSLPLGFAEGDRAELDRLNVRYEFVFDLGGVAGPLLVAFLMTGREGLAAHAAIPAAFALASLAYATIPRQPVERRASLPAARKGGGTLSGFKLVLRDPRLLFGVFSLAALNIFPLRKLLSALFAKSMLQSAALSGWLGAAFGIGGAVGSLLYGRHGARVGGAPWVFASAGGMLVLAASFFPASLGWMMAGAFLFALTNSSARLAMKGRFQETIPLGVGGGVTAVQRFASNIVSVLSKAAVGAAFAYGVAAKDAFALVSAGLAAIAVLQFAVAWKLKKI